jgi:hypothetical protein
MKILKNGNPVAKNSWWPEQHGMSEASLKR